MDDEGNEPGKWQILALASVSESCGEFWGKDWGRGGSFFALTSCRKHRGRSKSLRNVFGNYSASLVFSFTPTGLWERPRVLHANGEMR